jgi:RNA polymerase subunit RPABC4/transcription elongation factor Spt4
MPHIKPKTCHKCKRSYTGWRCPACCPKSSRASGGSHSTSRHTFNAATSILGQIEIATIATVYEPSVEYGNARICRHCGFLTTTRLCTYCGKD